VPATGSRRRAPAADTACVSLAGWPNRTALNRWPLLCRSVCHLGVFLTLLLLAAPWTLAQQDVLTDIKVTGNRKIPAETIKARIFSRPGDTYDAAALERDFNSLWNTGYFEDVRFERQQTPKGWVLHVYVKERPVIRDIEYLGISSVTTSDILERFKVAKVGLSKESSYDPTKVKHAEVVLKGLLSEHGRQFANVRTEVRQIPPAAVGITFVVKEGPKVKVGRIQFQGNKNVNTRTLRAAMKNLKPTGIPHSIFLENLFARTYDASKLDEDTERVRLEYQNRGYFTVVVQDPITKIRDTGSQTGMTIPFLRPSGGKSVDITMPIEEGDLYHLGSITFKGGKAFPNMKALRGLFQIKDGDIFNRDKVSKGLESLRKAYGEYGYINFTSLPDTKIDEAKKLVNLEIDLDEGKQFYVRRIEFEGNTTTRDKVIRREVVLEEGQVYNSRLWELSLLRLNQLGYFEQLKPDDPNVTDRKLNEKDGTVDLSLKVRERGKNSIGLTGGVSGLSGAFIGLNYATNNLFGLGETLDVQASVGNQQRNISLGFTEPYLFDRPLQAGFRIFASKYNFDQAKNYQLQTGQKLNLTADQLQNILNYTQSSTGFQLSLTYPLHRSFKRLGISYLFDNSSTQTFNNSSTLLFQSLAFRNFSGPNALNGIITSQITPSFSFSTLDSATSPHHGKSVSLAAEISGIGGNVRFIRPLFAYKQFFPMNKGRNAFGMNFQASFLTGYAGLVSPPQDRYYLGGENDLRGFDSRTITPYAYFTGTIPYPLRDSSGQFIPKDPTNPLRGPWTVPIPIQSVVIPGGDTSLVANFEYRITIAGPVAIAPFVDIGMNPILRKSQLRIGDAQFQNLRNTQFGCPTEDVQTRNCNPVDGIAQLLKISQNVPLVEGTNFLPRMSTGLELQVFLPVVNAPFRIYYAYNPLRLDDRAQNPELLSPDKFRSLFPPGEAGDTNAQAAIAQYGAKFQIREPRKTFRFTVATTF
jgi:outer membrane protein insertion porin family